MAGKTKVGRAPGFTLLELLVVLSVVFVTTTLAVPGFRYLLESSRVRTASVRLMNDIVLARSEAIKRNRQVVLCPAQGEGATAPACGGLLADGWIVFEDGDRDSSRDDGEPVLRVAGALANSLSLTNRSAEAAVAQPIRFRPDGTASGNRTLMICSRSAPRATSWSVVMNLLGRPRMARDWGVCPRQTN